MADLKLDSKVFTRTSNAGYGVDYYLYHEDGNDPGVRIPDNPATIPSVKALTKQACFASLLYSVRAKKRTVKPKQKPKSEVEPADKPKPKKSTRMNRVAYKPDIRTTDKDAVAWINLAVRAKLLPQYIKPEHRKTWFVLKFGSTKNAQVSPSLLYVYLTILRHLEEYPDLVRIALYLEGQGVDVYAAILLASRYGCGNSNHNFIDWSVLYSANMSPFPNEGERKKIENSYIPLRLVIALRRFVLSPRQFDDRVCVETDAWNVYGCINKAAGKLPLHLVQVKYLRHPCIVAAINADTNAEVKKHMAAFEAEINS